MLKIELLLNSKNVLELVVSYAEDKVVIENPFGVRKIDDYGVYFETINKYMNTMTEDEQRRFFVLVKRANRRIKSAPENTTSYMLDLKDTIRKAVGYFNYPRFEEWFRNNHQGLQVDPEMETVFVEDIDSSKTRSKTYVVSDYVDLVALILTFRALYPIYVDYLTYSDKSDEHPYYRVFNLFLGSQIDHDSQGALAKLREFMTENNDTLNGDKDREILVITAGLSDDDEVDNLLSSAVFTKVLWNDFFNSDTRIVSTIYNHILFPPLKKRGQSSPDKQLRYRSARTSGGDDDDYGYFERMLRTAEISLGDTVTLQESLKDDRVNLAGLGYDPDKFDHDFFKAEMENLDVFMALPVDPLLLHLLSWFYSRIISPDALYCIEDRRVYELMFMAKTLLYSSGNADQMYMGTVLSSLKDEEKSFINPGTIVKNSLGKDLLAKLAVLFPYAINDNGLTYETDIINVSQNIAHKAWRPQGYNNPSFVSKDGFLLIPRNINEVVIAFVELVINHGPKQ